MKLPLIKYDNAGIRELTMCQGTDRCSTCVLFKGNGGRCSGCTHASREAMEPRFQQCYRECNECAGYKVRVPTVCCRSENKDLYLKMVTKFADDVNKPVYNLVKRPKLSFKRHAILNLIFGSPARIEPVEPFLFPADYEVICTSLSFVSGFSGFFANDLKAYMKIHPDVKLILSTMSIDEHLERAWDREAYGADYPEYNIDYWMPLAFSSYLGEPKMHQYFQFLRMMYAAEKGESWFFAGAYWRDNLDLRDLFLHAMEATPQVMFNAQFALGIGEKADKAMVDYMRHAKRWHELAPRDVSFWYVGATTPDFMHNIRKVCPGRELYWVSGKPIYNAVNGKMLRNDGGEKKVDKSYNRRMLLEHNMEVFERMVATYGTA